MHRWAISWAQRLRLATNNLRFKKRFGKALAVAGAFLFDRRVAAVKGVAMDLSGDWTGVFDYGLETQDAVPFTATLMDVGGVVWGETQEPNTFAPNAGPELIAEVSGTRSGLEVHFRKAYCGKPRGGAYPIHYTGHISAGGKRIEGQWRINVPGVPFSGPFVMTRVPGIEVTHEIAKEAEVEAS